MIEKDDVSSGLIELYIGTFNRAPDQTGLSYWVNAINADNWTIEDVAASFFDQEETIAKYPASMSTQTYVETIYNHVLDRNPDDEGLLYWTTALETNAISRNNAILAIINGAKSGGTEADKSLLQHKHDVGQYFAIDLELEDLSLSKRIMEDVTNTIESRDRAKSTLDLFKAATDLNYIELDDNNNTRTLDETTDWLYAFDGNDTIQATQGVKWIHAGRGDDLIYGGEDNSTFHGGAGNDTMYGNGGDDLIYGDAGNDLIHGGDDNDSLYGDAGDDYLYGNAGDDILYGGDGNDVLSGGDGMDTLYGNEGDDVIHGNTGVNIIDGGAGNDILHGGNSMDTIYSGAGDDISYGHEGDDVIAGMSGNDTLYGGTGTDSLSGGIGADDIFGGEGDDTLRGEFDSDTLRGNAGSDTLSGGAGSDTFVFQAGDSDLLGYDSIIDFEFQDELLLVDMGAETVNNTAINVSSADTLSAAADLAAAGDGSVNANISWFLFEDDTYVVQDMSAASTFTNGTDLLIKLMGYVDLEDTLSNVVGFD
ncbi:MAG: DUF4214 domain-containing protein [Desulfobacterales bacterium]|nr:DUF4214 domain-containing protein [Desulfobacterales bacterium]